MVDRVLVPFDGAPLSRRALEWAAEEFPEATIHVLYVVDQQRDPTASEGWGDHPGEWEDWLADRESYADELFEMATAIATDRGATVETTVRIGRVVRETLDEVEEFDADLVVVGLHGRSSFVDVVAGDVAEAIVHRSPVPVVVVRNPPETTEG
ncbi:universal stress protein [Halorubellus salinus]|uniref:universal stress protein n=1 Tax=Halorubellus salinus TaxID=755309 RepID=UPI001D073117|nr:universal stress protein [Halorubellus salinus]